MKQTKLIKREFKLDVYELDGVDHKVGVARNYGEKTSGADFYYIDKDNSYKFIASVQTKDGSELTEDVILSHVAIAFVIE